MLKVPKNRREYWEDETWAEWGDWIVGNLFKLTCSLALLCFAVVIVLLLIGGAGTCISAW